MLAAGPRREQRTEVVTDEVSQESLRPGCTGPGRVLQQCTQGLGVWYNSVHRAWACATTEHTGPGCVQQSSQRLGVYCNRVNLSQVYGPYDLACG